MNTVLESNSVLKHLRINHGPKVLVLVVVVKKSIMIHACQLQWKSQVLMRHTFDVKEDWRETLLRLFKS